MRFTSRLLDILRCHSNHEDAVQQGVWLKGRQGVDPLDDHCYMAASRRDVCKKSRSPSVPETRYKGGQRLGSVPILLVSPEFFW